MVLENKRILKISRINPVSVLDSVWGLYRLLESLRWLPSDPQSRPVSVRRFTLRGCKKTHRRWPIVSQRTPDDRSILRLFHTFLRGHSRTESDLWLRVPVVAPLTFSHVDYFTSFYLNGSFTVFFMSSFPTPSFLSYQIHCVEVDGLGVQFY